MSNYNDGKSLFLSPKVAQYDGHMIMTNVSRPTKTKYISIDTCYRDNYSSQDSNATAACVITLPERITEVKTIKVHNIEIPNSIYNISSAIGNNCFQILSGATKEMVKIPDGNYSSETLVSQINTVIGALTTVAFRTLNLTALTVNKKSAFNVSSGGSLTVNFAVSADGSADALSPNRKLGWVLGFRSSVYTISSSQTISEAILNVYGFKYLYLVVDEFTKGNQNSFVAVLPNSLVRKTILARIALHHFLFPFGETFVANLTNGYLHSDRRSYTGPVDLQRLSIQLVDDVGKPVSLNGLDFSFCLEVEHE